MKRLFFALAAIAALLWASAASAHKPSDSYLWIEANATSLDVRLDVALRDLDHALGLDADADGAITWGEVRSQEARLRSFAGAGLALRDAATNAPLELSASAPLAIAHHSDGTYAVFRFKTSSAPANIELQYSLLFSVDPQHRCVARFVAPAQTATFVLSQADDRKTLDGQGGGALGLWRTMVRAGAGHVAEGYDHLLFLLALLLPSVLRRERGRWVPVGEFRSTFLDALKVVTSFTVAHSITLSLSALDLVRLPPRFVEAAIAVSVVLAAANNLRPVVLGDRWLAAFCLGLLHGFGFSTTLMDLGVPRGSLAASLFGFNLGVELGQISIVALVVPLAFLARRTSVYRGPVLVGGSAAAMAVATVWVVERAFDLSLL